MLQDILKPVLEQCLRFWFISFDGGRQTNLQRQHIEIVEAVADHKSGSRAFGHETARRSVPGKRKTLGRMIRLRLGISGYPRVTALSAGRRTRSPSPAQAVPTGRRPDLSSYTESSSSVFSASTRLMSPERRT